jgi:hypothetical protein
MICCTVPKDCLLKGTVSRDFRPRNFSSNNPIYASDSCSKIVSNFVANSPRYKRIYVVPRYAGIAQDHDPELCGIARDHGPALCLIARDKNGIALDQMIKL